MVVRLFLILSIALGVPAIARDACERSYARLAARALWTTVKVPLRVAGYGVDAVGTVGLMGFYPLHAVPRAAFGIHNHIKEKGGTALYRPLFKQVGEDKLQIVGWIALITLADGTAISWLEFDDETREFDEGATRQDRVVVVNFTEKGDPEYELLREVGVQRHGHRPANLIHHIDAKDYDDLLDQLEKIAATHGPIDRLDTYGHGWMGSLVTSGRRITKHSARNRQLPVGVMAKGAKVRFHSCLTGNGCKGEEFQEQIGAALLPEGGEVFASRTLMVTDISSGVALRTGAPLPPEWVRKLTDPLLRPVTAIPGVGFNLREQPEEIFPLGNRVRKVVISPRNP